MSVNCKMRGPAGTVSARGDDENSARLRAMGAYRKKFGHDALKAGKGKFKFDFEDGARRPNPPRTPKKPAAAAADKPKGGGTRRRPNPEGGSAPALPLRMPVESLTTRSDGKRKTKAFFVLATDHRGHPVMVDPVDAQRQGEIVIDSTMLPKNARYRYLCQVIKAAEAT